MSICPLAGPSRQDHASTWKCLARFFLVLVPLFFGMSGASRALPQGADGHTGTINAVAFSTDGKYLTTGGSGAAVKLWDLDAGTVVHTWTEHLDGVTSLDFSPDGTRLASGGAGGLVLIREAQSGGVLLRLDHGGPITCVRFAPDGGTLASAGGHQFVQLWDLKTGNTRRRLKTMPRTALEASGLDLNGTELVVLSACETGGGAVQTGEGVFGFRRALTLAGARSQMMSLWQVADQAMPALMKAYYERLKAGRGRSQALRDVQLEMLAEDETKHPFFWAAFIPSGDWRPVPLN